QAVAHVSAPGGIQLAEAPSVPAAQRPPQQAAGPVDLFSAPLSVVPAGKGDRGFAAEERCHQPDPLMEQYLSTTVGSIKPNTIWDCFLSSPTQAKSCSADIRKRKPERRCSS